MENNIDDEMINIFKSLLKLNTSICFISGRGRTSSKEVLLYMYEKLKKSKVDVKNITCASSNGSIFMYSTQEFLDTEDSVVEKETLENYIKNKQMLREACINNMVKQEGIRGQVDEFIKRSIKSSGSNSLRFPVFSDEIVNEEQLINSLKDILLKADLIDEYRIFKGIHKGTNIFEISLVDKLAAVKFLSEKTKIPENLIVRIGDQGQKYGNDFAMLNSLCGFSVDKVEEEEIGVLPVMGDKGNQVKNVNATKKILKQLNFDKDSRE